MTISKTTLPEWHAGSGTATTTPQQLPSYPAKKGVTVRNDGAAAILIGPNAAASFALAPGESQTIPVDDASKVFVVAASGSQAFSWSAI